MKFLSFALAALSACFVNAAPPTVHIFMIAGQQNAVGFNYDGHTDADKSYPNILQLNCCEDGNHVPLPVDQCSFNVSADPLLHNCFPGYRRGSFIGFGMSFAREMMKDMPEDDIIILIPAAQSPSGFMQGGWEAYNGQYFVLAQKKIQHVWDLVQQEYPTYQRSFDGILWNQGEWDAGLNGKYRALTMQTYLFSHLIPMIEAFRDPDVLKFTASNMPFIAGNMLESWVSNTSIAYGNVTNVSLRRPVSHAIGLLSQYCNYTAVAPSNGLQGGTKLVARQEPVWYTAASQRILGKRYYAAWKAAKLNQPESAGPIPMLHKVDEQMVASINEMANDMDIADLHEATSVKRVMRKRRAQHTQGKTHHAM